MEKALFINGVFKDVLDEIMKFQEENPGKTFYLQPYSESAIKQLKDEPPELNSPLPLYISTTDQLNEICYSAEIIGWEDKKEISDKRLASLNEHMKLFQPKEGKVYLEAEGKKCVNLISIRKLRKITSPPPTAYLKKVSDGLPLKPRTRSGGWSYVYALPLVSTEMNYWWVNQNQTHMEEIGGGYMWSPKKKADGSSNTFYDNMTRVAPGDIVFSYFSSKIQYLGVITSQGYSQAKPVFVGGGSSWGEEGWMVNVDYKELKKPIKPKDHIIAIRPLLPARYSPLQKNGDGIQNVYLTHVPEQLASKLLKLIATDREVATFMSSSHTGETKTDKEAEEDRIEKLVRQDKNITSTEKEVIVKARNGQGKFRDRVIALHKECPFTRISNREFLRAGHIKPWSKCKDNNERVDPLNGLPLTPLADFLVDQGYASFEDDGKILFSSQLKKEEIEAMGLDLSKAYAIAIFDKRQQEYLKYHREHIFKGHL